MSQLQMSCKFMESVSVSSKQVKVFALPRLQGRYDKHLTMHSAVLQFVGGLRLVGLASVLISASILPAMAQSSQALAISSATQPSANRPGALLQDTRGARQALDWGQRAEQDGEWERAFEAYSEAAAQSPNDHEIRLWQELARFQLVQQRTEQAAREILTGQTNRAREHLKEALRLDPGYTVARERLQQLGLQSSPVAVPAAQIFRGPARIDASPGTRDFDYRGTTRGAYEEIAWQFGVIATFDSDLVDRQIRFRVSEVDFETAMRLLSDQTATFWHAVDIRTFFVASDTPEKRRDYAPQVLRTIELPASETTDEMTEAMRLIREIIGIRRVELDVKTRTLTLRDTPENVALAYTLVKEIEQTRGELLLDIDILEVDRTAAQQLGIMPPSKVRAFSLSSAEIRQLTEAASSNTLIQAIQTIFGTPTPLTAAQGGLSVVLPPLIALGGGKTLFLATLPGASASFSQTLSVVRQAQRVLLRVTDGMPGTFFVGDRFPITLALLSASLIAAPSQFIPGILPGAFPRTEFAVDRGPAGVTVVDFNGDAKLDLAVVNQTDNTVSLLAGNGDGTFAERQDFATGLEPVAIAAQDFNRDGKPDMAVGNRADNTVSVLLGNGDGTLTAHIDFPTGMGPVAFVAADFDNDLMIDLAVVNQTDGTVSILLGGGDGTFAPKEDFGVDSGPSEIATADFDNDGHLDLAVTNRAANTVSILLGQGDGTFVTLADLMTGAGPSGVAAADFDADGRIDLAVTDQIDNSLSIYPGNGDGTFGDRKAMATASGPIALLVADVNSDTSTDLVTANQGDNSVSVFLGLGNGSFADPINLPSGDGPAALASADLDGDTLPDLVVANGSSNSITVTLNKANIPVTVNPPLTSYPASEYVDLGLKVRAIPRLHPDSEVTLDLQFEIKSLTGQNVNGIPILSNRTIEHTVRLKENQTSVLSGIVQSSDFRGISGLPGLARIGIAGHLAGLHPKQKSDTELLIVVTPRQLRLAPRTDNTIYAGRGTGSPVPTPETPAPPALQLPEGPVGAPPPTGSQPSVPPAATPQPGPPGAPPPNAPPAGETFPP